MNPGTRLATLLTFSGAIPFVAGALVLGLGPVEHRPLAVQAMNTYAAVILSFLGGIQWGLGVSIAETAPLSAQTLFGLSIVPSLLAWAMLFVPQANAQVMVAISLFGFVWMVDAMLFLQKLIPQWFFRLRCIITAIVVTCLIFATVRM